jgi:sugar lactone lactonase YvrE
MSRISPPSPVDAVLRRPHGLLEGPRIGAGGELVYSDVIAGGVYSCAPDGEVRELLPRRRGIGGIVPHADGGWVMSGRTLLHLAPDGTQRDLYAGTAEATAGFNDLASTPAGGLLAGELRYRPLAGEEPRPGCVLLLTAGGGVRVVAEDVTWPNGLGLAPDGRTLYISDYARRLVLSASLDGGGHSEFARAPRGSADGLAVDEEGGVWVALGEGAAVARFHPDGALDEVIELPATFVSSLSFGGEDMRDVLITTADNRVEPELGGTLLRARSEIPGLPVRPAEV